MKEFSRIELNEISFKQSLLRIVDLAKDAVSKLDVEKHEDAKKVLRALKDLTLIEAELKDEITYYRNARLYAKSAYECIKDVNVHVLGTVQLEAAIIIVEAIKIACESRVECM